MRLTRATPNAIKYACIHYHYSQSVPAYPIGYNVYNGNDEWCGVILYALGATPNIGSPYGIPYGGIMELVRVALNGKQEATSQAVAMSLKQLHKDVPQCRLIVSYADCDQDHLGTIYQATNWIYEGLSKGDTYFIINGKKTHRKSIFSRIVTIDGKRVHCPSTLPMVQRFFDKNATTFRSTGKRKYLMPMDKAMRKKILPLAKPYPKKDDNWQKIDRTQFKKDGKHTESQTLQEG